MQISKEFKQYLAGFFDGDGSITVEKLKLGGYTLRIKFCQSNLDWIKTIQRYYPYLKYGNNSSRNENKRIEYELRAAGNQIQPLVEDLLEFSILKYEQLLEAKKFFQYINVKNTTEEKEKIYQNLKLLKQNSINKPYNRLNNIYIAGLFDAEGCISLSANYSLRVGLVQKSDIKILELIGKKYNNTNKINNYSINFYSKDDILLFLSDIKQFCIYKTSQINSALIYLETVNKELPLTKEDKKIREKCYNELKDLKSIDINKDNIQFKNQEEHKNYIIKCFDNFIYK